LARRFITAASSSSGCVIERPMRQLQPSPISTTARPIQMMTCRVRVRDAASSAAALLALSRAAAMILSASGNTLSVSWLMSETSGVMSSVLATHCAKVEL
jgi:hypothetical protein